MELNQQPLAYKAIALPFELRRHVTGRFGLPVNGCSKDRGLPGVSRPTAYMHIFTASPFSTGRRNCRPYGQRLGATGPAPARTGRSFPAPALLPALASLPWSGFLGNLSGLLPKFCQFIWELPSLWKRPALTRMAVIAQSSAGRADHPKSPPALAVKLCLMRVPPYPCGFASTTCAAVSTAGGTVLITA